MRHGADVMLSKMSLHARHLEAPKHVLSLRLTLAWTPNPNPDPNPNLNHNPAPHPNYKLDAHPSLNGRSVRVRVRRSPLLKRAALKHTHLLELCSQCHSQVPPLQHDITGHTSM